MKKKDRVIVDIRDFNFITKLNAYSLSLQTNILIFVRKCKFISIIDCVNFFYQWRVHSNDKHKLIVMSHRKQKFFNVVVMRYKNSSTYVQRQINRFLRKFRKFVRVYVNDIVIFFHIKTKHETHFREIFFVLMKNNIFIKAIKTFLNYSSVSLLNQKMNFLRLTIVENKLKIIFKLRFSRIFRQLKFYMNFINWLRDYVYFYVDIFASLQQRKIELQRHELSVDNARRVFVNKTRIDRFIEKKLIFFKTIQKVLFKSFYLIHTNSNR